MTRTEAIKILKTIKRFGLFTDPLTFKISYEAMNDALDMAIEALQENESLAKSVNDAAELIHKLQKKNE